MLQVKVENIVDGPGPKEKLVQIKTVTGSLEEVPVPERMLIGNYLRASQVDADEKKVLVELPRESAAGNWRVWVDKGSTK